MEVPEDRLENIFKIQYKRGRITSSLQGWGGGVWKDLFKEVAFESYPEGWVKF